MIKQGVGVAVIALVASGCGGATIDDLARAAGRADDTALKSRLKTVNQSNQVADDVAKQYSERRGVVGKILEGKDDAVTLACAFFKARRVITQPRTLNELEAEQLRRKMQAQVDAGEVSILTIELACETRSALDGI